MRCQNKIYPRHIRLDASVGHHIPVFLLSVSHVITRITHTQPSKNHIHNLFFIRNLPGLRYLGVNRTPLYLWPRKQVGYWMTAHMYEGAITTGLCVYVCNSNYQCKSRYMLGYDVLCFFECLLAQYLQRPDRLGIHRSDNKECVSVCIVKIDCLEGFRIVCNELSTHVAKKKIYNSNSNQTAENTQLSDWWQA